MDQELHVGPLLAEKGMEPVRGLPLSLLASHRAGLQRRGYEVFGRGKPVESLLM